MTLVWRRTVKTKSELKTELARLVACKVELTRSRVALKRIPFKDRTSAQHSEMMRLWGECSFQKEEIRYTALAYAFVRGVRYWHVERDVHEQHSASARAIASHAGADEAAVKLWLADVPTPEERESWKAHLDAARMTARADRIERASRRTLSSMGLAS